MIGLLKKAIVRLAVFGSGRHFPGVYLHRKRTERGESEQKANVKIATMAAVGKEKKISLSSSYMDDRNNGLA